MRSIHIGGSALVALLALTSAQAPVASAALCKNKKSGAVIVKTTCPKKFVAVTAAEIGLGAASGGGLTLDGTGFSVTDGAITTPKVADGAITPGKIGTTPAARVYNSTNQSAANVPTFTTLAFDSERFDTTNLHDVATNNSRLTASIAGLYLVTINLSWDGTSSAGAREVAINKNGTTIVARDVVQPASGGNTTEQSLTTLVTLAAGDYVEVKLRQNSGGAVTVNSFSGTGTVQFSPEFSMVWMSPSS